MFSCQKDDNIPSDNETIQLGLVKDLNINIDNIDREYHLYIPSQYVNAPVVVLLHGHNSSHNELLGFNGESSAYKVWLNLAEQENIILAVPNGLFVSTNEKGWNDCRSDAPTNSKADDVQFISLLIDHLTNAYQADSKRIYINGTSNGGHMCIRLANELPEKITAIAAIISSNSASSECASSVLPISALFMNGTADPILPYDGGEMASNRGKIFSIEDTVNDWINRNGTETTPDFSELANTNLADDSNVEKYSYKNGSNNTEVVLYKIINGGHTDPSIKERYNNFVITILGNQNADIEMAEEVWIFFRNKSK